MTEQTTVPGSATREAGSGPLGLGVVPLLLVSPVEAFRRLAREPRWIGPFVLGVLLVTIGMWLALTVTLEASAQKAEQIMGKLGVPEAKRTEALANLPSPDDRSAAVLIRNVAVPGLIVVAFGFLMAGVLHLFVRLSGRTPAFRQTLTLFSAGFVVVALGDLVKSALMAASGTMEVTLGPGALIPDLRYDSVPSILLDFLDVFSVWNLVLLTIGGAVLWGTTRRASFGICGTFWLLKGLLVVAGRLFGAWLGAT
ncbi:MAG: YIP1 family protein [bacterium]